MKRIHTLHILLTPEAAKYAKRAIESNWSKYEMPPSDEEVIHILQRIPLGECPHHNMSEIKNILQEEVAEGGMTGADFNYVLGSAQGAESHFRWLELPSSKLILSHLVTAFTNHLQVKS